MSGTLLLQQRRLTARRGASLPHMVGLDGLRAVAVLAVVLYHAGVAALPGGFLGVDVFFVLSGFLITSLLLVEVERTGRVSMRQFYVRRARRLLPALLAVLAVTAVLVATIAYDVAASFRRDLPGAVLYVANWSNILTETSYFEFIGRPPMLKHLWSLAVEEQFYLVWPAVLVVLHRWRGPSMVGRVALGGALVSSLLMASWSVLGGMPTGQDPSRLYFGTDTHAMGVLVGAALAVVWRPGRTAPVLRPGARRLVSGAGVLGLVGLAWCFHVAGEYSTFLYRGGFLLVAGLAALVVAAASHRGVGFGRWLGMRPMRWVGERSYGIYLWHWPLFLVTRPGVDMPLTGAPALALRLVLLGLVAQASYRYIEMPVRRGALARVWRRLRDGDVGRPAGWTLVAAGVVTVLALVTGYRVWTAPAAVAVQASDELPAEARLAPVAAFAADLAAGDVRYLKALRIGGDWAAREDARLVAEARDRRTRATAFGDSVLLGASPALEERTFRLDLHARVAQQAGAVVEQVAHRMSTGGRPDVVIVHVGNNGIITEKQLRSMLEALLSVRRVVLVNVRVPRPWMAPNNRLFAAVAPDYPNTRLVDWAALSDGHEDYVVRDGVHLTWKGARAYTRAIAEAAGVES